MKHITIKGAREHNLKNINIELPRDKLIVITGLSGSGKSSLAFDTIYAEGQRRYVESLSSYARQFLGQMNKPDVDRVEGLSPAISIDQKTTSRNPRSTVGTVTEIYDYLRLLFARVGKQHCPNHPNITVEPQSPQKIAQRIAEECKQRNKTTNKENKNQPGKETNKQTTKQAKKQTSKQNNTITILSPIIRQKKGTYEKLVSDLNKEGYMRVRINGKIQRTDEKFKLDRYKKHDIEAVIDRVDISDTQRLTEAVENSLKKSEGTVIVAETNKVYSSHRVCPECGMNFEELQPRMFSFNSPFGACETCNGLGIRMDFDENLIIPDKTACIADGAIAVYRNAIDGWRGKYLGAVAKHYGFDIFTPINKLTKKQYNILMNGSDDRIRFNIDMKKGEATWSHMGTWEGLLPQSERLYQQTESEYRRKELEKYMRISSCNVCSGKRLKPKTLAVKISDKSIIEITDMSVSNCVKFFNNLKLSNKEQEIARQVLKEIKERLQFLERVGLGYLSLSRTANTLSGGEAQRIRLATQIGSNLMGVLYILDEPSIGLHQRDNKRLIATLQRLRDLGNTVIVVEHDEETMRASDHLVDMGPGAGIHGGKVIAQGTPQQIIKNPKSITGQYLSGKKKIEVPKKRRKSDKYIHATGCSEHNLKNIDVKIPIGLLTLITGVSGSGKSTLLYDILYRAMSKKIYKSKIVPGKHKAITTDSEIDKVVVIDQSPIGKTPRSNPATYTKVFDEVRKLFSQTSESRIRGYKPGRFSFNVPGGRCEACQGDGVIKIEMNFLPDVYIECEECKGKRYNRETLEIRYKGKTIADVLALTVEEAETVFENIPAIKKKLETLSKVGLDYIHLGQSSITLSGGEAQRIKLTRELAKKATGKTFYLLDEPTTGLHFHDVRKLIAVLTSLVEKGNTIAVIEHNLDIIKSADYVIDLGPEGGDLGGNLVAEGTPEQIAKNKKSYTGKFLKKIL